MFKVFKGGQSPTRGTKYSACVDLYAREDVTIGAGETRLIPLGVCIDLNETIIKIMVGEYIRNNKDRYLNFDEVKGIVLSSHYLQLMLRSSLSKELIIANGVGVIDLDYKDEIMVRVHKPIPVGIDLTPLGNKRRFSVLQDKIKIKKGQRVAQITLLEHKSYLFGIDTEDERTGGFGSTNKKDGKNG